MAMFAYQRVASQPPMKKITTKNKTLFDFGSHDQPITN